MAHTRAGEREARETPPREPRKDSGETYAAVMAEQVLRDRVITPEVPGEERAHGRSLRKEAPRSGLGQLVISPRSAVEILVEQNRTRVASLVPLRFARMLTDPFSFYRGSAAVMAADLAVGPSSGIPVYSCGDAHLSNFGIYAAPDRALIFDLNDFDETAMAPAEWDLKRLVTSGIVGGRHAGYSEKVIRKQVAEVLASYRRGLQDVLDMGILDRYYLRFEPERYNARAGGALAEVIARTTRQARKRTSKRVFGRIMEERPDGSLRLRENPPVLRHLKVAVEDRILATFREYLTTVPPDVALVLSHFKVTDIAQRVVGVGSVGTRCYLVIMTGPCGTPLVMQVKEAGQSVLESYGAVPQSDWMHRGISERGEGARVVAGQQVLQASSDVFLGALRWDGRDYYVRQFHDMKGSVDTEIMSQREFGRYVSACALVLARAHAQSRNATVWAGYIGKGGAFDEAITQWSFAYADKAFGDYQQLVAAAAAGEIEVADDPLR